MAPVAFEKVLWGFAEQVQSTLLIVTKMRSCLVLLCHCHVAAPRSARTPLFQTSAGEKGFCREERCRFSKMTSENE